MFIQGLGLLAFLLGVYIIFFNGMFFSKKPDLQLTPKYQLGCYLINNSNNNYFKIKQDIYQINYEYQREKRKLQVMELYNMESQQIFTLENKNQSTSSNQYSIKHIIDYDQTNIKLASNIQKYINSYIADKIQKKQDHQLQQALNSAQKSYEKCKKDVLQKKQEFNISNCQQDWQNYKICRKSYDSTNLRLTQTLNKKKLIMQKIQKFMEVNISSKSVNNKEKNIIDSFQKQFNRLQNDKERVQTHLVTFFKNKNETEFQLKRRINDFDHSNNIYQQCKKNRKQYNYCKNISQDVKTLKIDIQILSKKIQQKMKILKKFKDLTDQTDNQDDRKTYQEYWTKNFQDLKDVMNLYVQAKTRTFGTCGCSLEEEKEYFKVLNQNRALLDQIKKRFENQNNFIQSTQKQLKLIKAQAQRLIAQYQDKTNKSKRKNNTQSSKKDQQELNKLNNAMIQLNNQIISYQSELQNHKSKCLRLEEKMSQKLPYIDSVSNCISKFYYLTELRKISKRDQMKMKQSPELYQAKKILINYLSSIKI